MSRALPPPSGPRRDARQQSRSAARRDPGRDRQADAYDYEDEDDGRPHTDDGEDLRQPAGRVPWADRNWRIPTIIGLVAALVVIGAVILLLPGDEIAVQDAVDIGELRELPERRWDEDLDGLASGITSDGEALYVVVAKSATTELVALELATGAERWRAGLGQGDSTSTGAVRIFQDGLAVVVGASSAGEGSFSSVDPKDGTVRWSAPTELVQPQLISDVLISSSSRGGRVTLTAIDGKAEKLGRSVDADSFFPVGDDIYLNNAGVLTRASASTLEMDGDFRSAQTADVTGAIQIADDLVIAAGDEIVRLDSTGAEKYAFDPEIGPITALLPLQGDVVLAGAARRMRAVAVADEDASAVTAVRSGGQPLQIQTTDEDEFVVVFDGQGSGRAPATVRIMQVVDEAFDQVSEFEVTTLGGPPSVAISGSTMYSRSFEPEERLIALDFGTGERLWGLTLTGDQPSATLAASGVIGLSREDEESVVAFYSTGP